MTHTYRTTEGNYKISDQIETSQKDTNGTAKEKMERSTENVDVPITIREGEKKRKRKIRSRRLPNQL
jgi:hypothetical protein